MKRTVLFTLLFILPAVAEAAPHFSFRNFLSQDGLPVNTVTCSTSDRLGYLWFGTRDGICRFDGSEFTLLEPQEGVHSAGSMVYSISQDRDGNVWFCTVNGTGYYNIYTGEMADVEELSGRKYSDITSDGEGNVWFTSPGCIVRRDCRSGELTAYESGNATGAVHSTSDSDGSVWFTSRSGGLFRWDSATSRFTNLIYPAAMGTGEHPECIAPIDDSHLILSTNHNRILLYDIRTEKAITVTETENHVNCMTAKTPVEIWIGSSEGTLIYDRLKDELHQAYETSGNEMTKNITCILKDCEGNVWTGSFYGGLNIWNSSEHSIARYSDTGKKGCFQGHLTHAFTYENDESILIGTEDGFINRMNLSGMTLSPVPVNGRPSSELNIHGLVSEGKKLWIATFGGGLCLMDTGTGICARHQKSPSDTCICLKKLKDGTLLAGTVHGLYKYSVSSDNFEPAGNLGTSYIHAIAEDSKGRIWVGTYGDGLFRSDDLSGTFSPVCPECSECSLPFARYTTHLFEDSDGNIWTATDGTGLHKLSPDGTLLSHLTRDSGLPSNIATAIAQDSDGNLWVSTTKGIAVIDIATSKVEKIFTDYSHTTGDQYINGAVLALKDGRLFFGTTNGFITVNPSSITDPLSQAPVYFSSISTGLNEKTDSHTEDGKSVSFTEKLKFREKEAGHLTISFSTPYFSDLFTPQYETVLLRGNRELTRSVTTGHSVSFTRLLPGKYTFKVHLVGSQNEESYKSLSIRITPPFYHSAAAVIFVILLIIGAALFIQKRLFSKEILDKENQVKLLESRKQQEISESKLEFMTQITHKIRTPLSLIKMPIEKIIKENDYTESSKEDIFTIRNNTDRLLELTDRFLEIRNTDEKPAAAASREDKAAPAPQEDNTAEEEQEQQPAETSSNPTVLVVEDEGDMRLYLEKELSSSYNILTAANGEEAVNIIKESRVDLVVSDIMMPVMDGCQLCNFIKTNEEYSHIPVILLTAVVGVETRIETLESGADGYIEKPFKMELLKANIQNLFRNKEIFYRQFANSPLSHFRSTTPNKVENAFMEKLHSAVMKHLADQELGIEMLTDILGTSKTTLYRKIKSNTGLNTNEYIRLCRLKKAADMLSSQEYRINEVAYLTGFSSPSYFATSFQKQFNISPSAFVKNLKG